MDPDIDPTMNDVGAERDNKVIKTKSHGRDQSGTGGTKTVRVQTQSIPCFINCDDRFAVILMQSFIIKDPSRQVRCATVAGLVQNDCFLGQSEGQYRWGEAAGGFFEAIAKSMAVPKADRILQAHVRDPASRDW